MAGLSHKLDDFFIGHRDLALSLRRQDGAVFYQASDELRVGGSGGDLAEGRGQGRAKPGAANP
jgi:two-component system heavy metal sensor histidine kinase CusS